MNSLWGEKIPELKPNYQQNEEAWQKKKKDLGFELTHALRPTAGGDTVWWTGALAALTSASSKSGHRLSGPYR